ncbi:PAS domain S-box protein [Haloprofundus salinisoli]|uniref:PAS domain S-box protein n=1 Tax=Haloprofundus salinisoli TaxID=2876193 RepID=UPI001CCE9839|nr:PAS domain S-box protein [Haloprofundus salinisoli]
MTDEAGDGPSSSQTGLKESADASQRPDGDRDLQFRALVDAVEEYAIFRLDPDGYVASWNSGAAHIKGYAEEEIVGKHFSNFYTEGDRAAGVPEKNLTAAAQRGSVEDEGWRVRKDGSQFWANVTITTIRDDDGDLRGFAKVTRDMTDRKRAREEHQLHLSVSQAVAEATSLEAGIQTALEEVCERTDWVVGQAWMLTDDGIAERLPVSYAEDPKYVPFEESSRDFTFESGEGIPGQVIESGEPVWFPDVTDISETSYPRKDLAAQFGLQAGMGVPVMAEGEVAVVLEFYMAEERGLDDHLVELVGSIGADLEGLVAREQIKGELDRERQLLAEMMEAAPVGISVHAADGRVERMNEQAMALRHLGPDAAKLDADDRVFFDEEGTRIPAEACPFALVRESGRPVYDWTAQIELPDGKYKWLSIDAAPIESDEGTLDRVVIVEDDITELREQYRAVTGSINDVIVTVDEDSIINSVNPAVSDIFGYDRTELIGESLTELMPEAYHEQHYAGMSRYLETGERTLDWDYVELPGMHANGTEIPLAISFSEITYRGDRYFTGVIRDISARKEAERRLEARARQQEAIAEFGQFALEVDDLDELMHEAARRVADVLDNVYCKVLDLDPDERELLLRQGVGWQEGIVGHATVAADDNSQAGYTLLSDEPVIVEDLDIETRFSGPELLTSHDVTSGISTIIGSVDEPWGILGTHDTRQREFTEEDVNFVQSVANILADAIERHRYQADLERLIDDLEESNERLEQFAYAASHDLQEPLRMVSSYLQLIDRRYRDELDEDAEEFIGFAIDGAERMRAMINSLLEYSRVETRGDPFKPVELDPVLDDVIEDHQMKIEESDAEITTDPLPRVKGDASQLRQVFQNLLDNAIEYSGDEPPRVHITAERDGDMHVISVRDEGIGIDSDAINRIFNVFQRLHTRDEHPGTGIGLALCERIVERHGGEIWVDSEPDVGSTFSFTLPVASSSVPSPTHE